MDIKKQIECENVGLAYALHNLCVRNGIDYKDMIKTMREANKEFYKNIEKLKDKEV